MADVTAKASVTVQPITAGVVAAAHASVITVRQVTETVVREVQQIGFTADEVRQLRDILKDSQTVGGESPIPGRLAAELPKAAGLWEMMQSQGGVALATWILVFLTVLGLLFPPEAQHTVIPAPTEQVQVVTPAQIQEIVEQVVKDLDQPPQAPPGTSEPSSPPTT